MAAPHPPHWRGWRHHLGQAFIALAIAGGGITTVSLLAAGPDLLCTYLAECKPETARLDIQNIGNALELHRMKSWRYPTTREGLQALVSSESLEKVPIDPWGNEYRYALWQSVPRIWSYGADGLPGGSGVDADVYNISPLPYWMIERDEPTLSNAPSPRLEQ